MLVAVRAMGPTWANAAVTMRLDCEALVHTLRKGYHQHDAVNTIMQELSDLQIKHSFTLQPMWVRRCWNETADALSKDNMDRFWLNVKGDRTLTKLEPHHLAPPLASSIQGSGPRKPKRSIQGSGPKRPKRSRHGHRPVDVVGLVAHGGLRKR